MVNFFLRFPENELLPHFRERFFNFSKILKNLNKEYALKRLISRKHKLIEYPSQHGYSFGWMQQVDS